MEAMRFAVELPVPPLYNHAVVHTSRGHYPSAGYQAWLGVVNEVVRDNLRSMHGLTGGVLYPKPTFCRVVVELHLSGGRRGDVDGYLKPILDALGGAAPGPERRIVRDGLVYEDDRQVTVAAIRLVSVGGPEGLALVRVEDVEPPICMRPKRTARARRVK
jgi:Holliday junction resolvase RusA-like endonuclease